MLERVFHKAVKNSCGFLGAGSCVMDTRKQELRLNQRYFTKMVMNVEGEGVLRRVFCRYSFAMTLVLFWVRLDKWHSIRINKCGGAEDV